MALVTDEQTHARLVFRDLTQCLQSGCVGDAVQIGVAQVGVEQAQTLLGIDDDPLYLLTVGLDVVEA